MANSLYPAFIVINEHSEFGAHKRTIPTRAWTGTTGASGSFTAWDTTTISDTVMVGDLVSQLITLAVTTYNFDDFIVYTMDTPTSVPRPRFSDVIDLPGTLTAADAVPASQGTMSFRTAGFGKFKFVLLDAIPSGDFLPQKPGDFTGDQLNLALELQDSSKAWAGRDGTQISTLIGLTWTLNEKLRRSYRLN